MADKKKTRKQTPFIDRFTARVSKTLDWAKKTQARFGNAPSADVSDALLDIATACSTALNKMGTLKGWAPTMRSPSFGVGDMVLFKKPALDELLKSGLYKKADMEGQHKVEAVAGRKVKLSVGVFASRLVTKST